MKRFLIRKKSNIEVVLARLKSRNLDFIDINVGTNSIAISFAISVLFVIAFNFDVLDEDYLKSISQELAFFIGFFSLILGAIFLKFWKLDRKSQYIFHLTRVKKVPKNASLLFTFSNLCFAISYLSKVDAFELSISLRRIFCIGIFFLLALITLDNRGFSKVTDLPQEIAQSSEDYCPEKLIALEEQEPKEGCALILKAFKLGYAKDLGQCEPQKIDIDKLKVCEKRRENEPYFHFFARQIANFTSKSIAFFSGNEVKNIKKKFEAQLEELEALKDYQTYAISASPRASHHIWTNLPFPEPDYYYEIVEKLLPGRCLEQFQNQTNTIVVEDDDKRKHSKFMEHAYGQLLFNPNVKLTAGFCKEFTIHWNAEVNTCEQLALDPVSFLTKEKVLPDIELVLKRHDLAKVILALDEKLREFGDDNVVDGSHPSERDQKQVEKGKRKTKRKISTSKIAKDERQIRTKDELVSFQCFMRDNEQKNITTKRMVALHDTEFSVPTRYFPIVENGSDPQLLMYKQFSSVMEDKFRYTQYNSQSDIKLGKTSGEEHGGVSEDVYLQQSSYLMARLEVLKNVDVFLDNEWVLRRDDLLEVYPYHVHLKNYVERFRVEYTKNHGRL